MAKKRTSARAIPTTPTAKTDELAETVVDPHTPLPAEVSKKIEEHRPEGHSLRALRTRQRRLARAGVDVDTCPVLGLDLDAGPRAGDEERAVDHGGVIMSERARQILALGATADELERVAEWLRERAEG